MVIISDPSRKIARQGRVSNRTSIIYMLNRQVLTLKKELAWCDTFIAVYKLREYSEAVRLRVINRLYRTP
jgi:hypothetical protein